MICSILFAVQILYCLHAVNACYIWGTDSGECKSDGMVPIWRGKNVPFCANAINYPVCTPIYQKLSPTKDFPEGRWFESTTLAKDNWVEARYNFHIRQAMGYERNKSLAKSGHDINGHLGRVHRRFWKRKDCQNAFKNLFCWINFPRCDPAEDLTLPTCRSACENFFHSCKYKKDLWRCGKSKWFNGYAPEAPIALGPNSTYLREYFPGQPWRQNKYSLHGSELPICTPAILGSGSRTQLYWLISLLLPLLGAILLIWY